MRTSALLLAGALAACNGSKSAPAQPVAPPNKCAHVADHLLSLMTKTAQDAPAEELDRVRAHFHKRCTEDRWSADAQQCFLSLTAREDVNRCAAQLTDEQRTNIEQPP